MPLMCLAKHMEYSAVGAAASVLWNLALRDVSGWLYVAGVERLACNVWYPLDMRQRRNRTRRGRE